MTMFDFLLSEEEKVFKAEARRFAKEDVPSSLIRDMDAEGIRYPKEFLQNAASLGMARSCLEIAARYSNRRKAFGELIRNFQAVSFKIADCVTRLDAARSLVYVTGRQVDEGMESRRIVSEAKKTSTEMLWSVVNECMQVMGGIGYTNVYPVERFLRDARLQMIWTGTNEVMSLLIQHEYYRETLTNKEDTRNIELDAVDEEGEEEKVYE